MFRQVAGADEDDIIPRRRAADDDQRVATPAVVVVEPMPFGVADQQDEVLLGFDVDGKPRRLALPVQPQVRPRVHRALPLEPAVPQGDGAAALDPSPEGSWLEAGAQGGFAVPGLVLPVGTGQRRTAEEGEKTSGGPRGRQHDRLPSRTHPSGRSLAAGYVRPPSASRTAPGRERPPLPR